MTKFGRNGRLVPVVLLLTGTVGLSACGPGEPSSPPSVSPTSSTPSTSPSTRSPADVDEERAGQAVIELWNVIDKVGTDPKSKLEEINTVARGTVNTQWTKNLFDRRVRGERFVGHTTVKVLEASLKKAAVYEVSACLDFSGLNVVDSKGKSIVPADRQPRLGYTYEVTQDKKDQKWYVTTEKVTGPC